MDVERAVDLLEEAGYQVVSEGRLGNDVGTQLKLASGQSVSIYDKGTFLVQGKNPEPVREILDEGAAVAGVKEARAKYGGKNPPVFVVYGHDQDCRNQLEAMLRRWGLEPLILEQLPAEGQTVIEKLEATIRDVGFGVVLATPDDQGHRAQHPDEEAYRVRQNVVLELGMLLTRLGRRRVAILIQNPESMERPSDIQGLIYIPFKDNLEKEAGLPLAKTMVAAGYKIDVSRL